jgi:hypothetical protein
MVRLKCLIHPGSVIVLSELDGIGHHIENSNHVLKEDLEDLSATSRTE